MKKIGIIGAMELEVETLKAHMTTTNITTKANMEFHEGTPKTCKPPLPRPPKR